MNSEKFFKVLLIEGDSDIAYQTSKNLKEVESFNLNVDHVERLDEAYEYLSKEKTDLIILDLNLPDSKGINTLSSVYNNFSDIPIVALIDYQTEEERAELFKYGASDYLMRVKQTPSGIRQVLKHVMDWHEFLVNMEEQRSVLKELLSLIENSGNNSSNNNSVKQEALPSMSVAHITERINNLSKAIEGNTQIISKIKNQNLKFEHLAHHDALTNLANRLQFEKALSRSIAQARRHERKLGLLLLDLDNFKNINDNLGHHIGDLLLKEVANRLMFSVREEDFVARLGGDEFAIILTEITDIHVAGRIAQKLISLLGDYYDLDHRGVHTGASIGIAIYPYGGTDIVTLMKSADLAMYSAKKQGRGNYQYFRSDIDERYKKRVKVEANLSQAIENNEFFILYQPRYDLTNGQVVGVEALIRWKHPELGVILPNDFIPIAEETGLITEIDQWVLNVTCKQFVNWKANGIKGFQHSINLSGRELLHSEFPMQISKILKETGLRSKNLILQFNETKLMKKPEMAAKVLKQLSNMDLKIAIDDFGVGYSSLKKLKLIPLDIIMIDNALIENLENDKHDAAIVKSIILLAKNLNLEVVAEGVETQAQYQFLKDNHCQQAQGNYFSQPLQPKAAEGLLASVVKKRKD